MEALVSEFKRMGRRVDIKAILADPERRKRLLDMAVKSLVEAKWIR